jgi:hypothetical protein
MLLNFCGEKGLLKGTNLYIYIGDVDIFFLLAFANQMVYNGENVEEWIRMNYFFVIKNAMPSCHIGCLDVVLRSGSFYKEQLEAAFPLQSQYPPVIAYVRDNPSADYGFTEDTIRAKAVFPFGGTMEIIYTTHPEALLEFVGEEAVKSYLTIRNRVGPSEYFGYPGFTVFCFNNVPENSPIVPARLVEFKNHFIKMCIEAHTKQFPTFSHLYFMRQNNIEVTNFKEQAVATSAEAATSAAKPKKKGCYVATAVYGSYNCPQVWVLRRYRDARLNANWFGRAFIKCYYAVSPTLVRLFGNTKWFNALFKNRLDRLVMKLKDNGYSDQSYFD